MDRVTMAAGGTSVVFHSRARPGGGDYSEGEFVVEAAAAGLEVTRSVFMIDKGWAALTTFFDDLAASWRGWEGEKVWASIQHDLRLTAVADELGHVRLSFTIQNGPTPSWTVDVSDVRFDAGEDLSVLARQMSGWVGIGPST